MISRIGHRGAAGYFPENTILSFRKALELGADAVECDVHLCKSGEPVVIHDATLQRTTNGKGRVVDFTLKELKTLDAGNGERIPTLKELLEKIAPKATVYIEIKAPASVDEVAKIVRYFAETKTLGYARLPVLSFDRAALLRLKTLNPKILTGIGVEKKSSTNAAFIARAKKNSMWAVVPCITHVTAPFVARAHAAGLRVLVWTVNRPAQIKKARALEVDGIMGDYPDRIPA